MRCDKVTEPLLLVCALAECVDRFQLEAAAAAVGREILQCGANVNGRGQLSDSSSSMCRLGRRRREMKVECGTAAARTTPDPSVDLLVGFDDGDALHLRSHAHQIAPLLVNLFALRG